MTKNVSTEKYKRLAWVIGLSTGIAALAVILLLKRTRCDNDDVYPEFENYDVALNKPLFL